MLGCFPCVRLCVTLWTVTVQTLLFMGFFRQEYWSGLPYPPPGNLQVQGLNPSLLCLLHWQAGSLPLMPSKRPMGKSTSLTEHVKCRVSIYIICTNFGLVSGYSNHRFVFAFVFLILCSWSKSLDRPTSSLFLTSNTIYTRYETC